MMADLILMNGCIWTGNHAQPWAEALACLNGKILDIGKNQDIHPLIGRKTQVIDLKGRLTLPGFNDAHVDFYRGGLALRSVDLRDAADEADFIRRIARYAEKLPGGRWILEGNWNHENWPGKKLPCKELIDPASPLHPVLVCRSDEHVSLANSLALKMAGITARTLNPPGGEIRKDPHTGEPTGILVDTAQDLVSRIVTEPTSEEIRSVVMAALCHANTLGITSIQDNASTPVLKAYQNLLKEGELTVRVNAWRPIAITEQFVDLGIEKNFGGDMLKVGVVKIFADGSMGASSALFFEPYQDDPSHCGLAMHTEEKLTTLIARADEFGLQCAVHAIGDRANHMVLNAFQHAMDRNGDRPRRHRIEHVQVIRPADILRMRNLGIIASIQPSHFIDDIPWAEKRIGAERMKHLYLWQTLLNEKIRIAFGTDWPVTTLNPMVTLFAAVSRQTMAGDPVPDCIPEERMSLDHALECYTSGSAYAEFAEHAKGTLEPRKYADMVVLSQNLFELDPRQFPTVAVDYTIMNGRIVYERR